MKALVNRRTGLTFPVKVVRDLTVYRAENGRKTAISLRQRLPMHDRLSARIGG